MCNPWNPSKVEILVEITQIIGNLRKDTLKCVQEARDMVL